MSSNSHAQKKFAFNQKLLPVAVAMGMSLVAVQEAAADGVTVYGRAHVTVDQLDNGADSDLTVSSNSSRLGFKASTDIADGLKGIMQIESEVRFDEGSGNFATRDSYVGLQGGFGTVRLGQMDTPLKLVRGAVDFFGDQIGDVRNLTRLNSGNGAPYGQDFDARFKNGVFYNTKPFAGGFVFNLYYTPQVGGVDLENDSAAYSTSVTYEAGNLYLALAQEQWETRNDSSALRFGARYKAGNWTVGGLFQQATVKTATAEEDVTTLGLGTSYKVSSEWTLKGQVYSLDAKDRDDSGATLIAIGADYSLSKQFRLLFAYAQADNDDLATYRISGGGYGDAVGTVAGEAATGLSFGMRYDF